MGYHRREKGLFITAKNPHLGNKIRLERHRRIEDENGAGTADLTTLVCSDTRNYYELRVRD